VFKDEQKVEGIFAVRHRMFFPCGVSLTVNSSARCQRDGMKKLERWLSHLMGVGWSSVDKNCPSGQ
jgi:hypothetical protein